MRSGGGGATAARCALRRWIVVAACLLAGCTGTNPYYDASKAHHTPDGFRNVDPAAQLPRPFRDFIRWQIERRGQEFPPPTMDLSVVRPDPAEIRAAGARRDGLFATWIGHATVLVQMNGVAVLTDPHFSERASPVQWIGPKRFQPPALAIDELPRIDIVVISHNHYDHLDAASVRALNAQPGGPPLFVVPLGIERWMAKVGITNVKALDWWESVAVGAATVWLVPVQHWSKRTLTDTNTTLWGGFVVQAGEGAARRTVFHGGDAGYSRAHFREIGERFGPIDLALLPIGAYEPRWFMSIQHVNPEEAVLAHRDLRARKSLGMHWGTFRLSDEPLDRAARDLAAARTKLGVPDDEFVALRHGESLRIH